jgi:hypothetical protein
MLLFKGEACRVMARVSEFVEPRRESQHEKNAGVSAHRYRGIALLNPHQSHPADPGTLGHKSHGDTATASGISDVGAQLLEGPLDRQW